MRADARLTPGMRVLLIGCLVGLLAIGAGMLRASITASSAAEVRGAPEVTPPEPAAAPPEPASPVRDSFPAEAAEEVCTPGPLDARAAAVLVVGLPGVVDADEPLAREVADLGVGGILITKANVAEAGQIRSLIAGLRERSTGPLVVTTDEEPGRVSSFGGILGRTSSARTLSWRATLPQVHAQARDLAEDLRRFGVDVVLSPVADLDDGPSGGVIGDRSFSVDPHVATSYVRAHAEGLVRGGVLPAVKHFPGHGRTAVDSHRELPSVEATLGDLRRTDLVPFADQIARGAPIVMLGHVAYEAFDGEVPASLAPEAYALLRAMGFEGVAMTDSLGMGAVNLTWGFAEAAVLAVAAGADAVLATDGGHATAMRDAIVEAVESGRLPEERLDEAVARMRHLAGGDPTDLVCVDVPFPALPGPPPRL